MEYRLVPAGNGVWKVMVGDRWIGHVSRAAAERELWVANLGKDGSTGFGSLDEAAEHVVRHAADNPDFEM